MWRVCSLRKQKEFRLENPWNDLAFKHTTSVHFQNLYSVRFQGSTLSLKSKENASCLLVIVLSGGSDELLKTSERFTCCSVWSELLQISRDAAAAISRHVFCPINTPRSGAHSCDSCPARQHITHLALTTLNYSYGISMWVCVNVIMN